MLVVPAQKGSAGTITIGQAVYISGYDVGAGTIEVELADASGVGTMPAFGIAAATIGLSTTGNVIVSGELTGLDLQTFLPGDPLYVSETPGALTDVKPISTALVQKIGIVSYQGTSPTTGILEVFGAGRSNDLPNLASDTMWVGDTNGVPAAVDISTFGQDLVDSADAAAARVTLEAVGGPASAVDNNIATFDLTTGKLIQDSTVAITAISDAQTTADAALPKSGGTMTGDIALPSGSTSTFGPEIALSGTGAALTVKAGQAASGVGGQLKAVGGTGSTNGGHARIEGGAGIAGTGGDVRVLAGQAPVGGNVTIDGGVGTGGAGGDVSIDGGVGTTTNGAVSVGADTSTSAVSIGGTAPVTIAANGVLTNIRGTLTVDESVTLTAKLAVDQLAPGTDTYVLKTVGTTPTWSVDSGGGGDVTAAATLTEDYLVSGDTAAKGVKDSTILASDVSGHIALTNEHLDWTLASQGTVDISNIADNAVTLAKIATKTDTNGGVLGYDIDGNPVEIEEGTIGQVLLSKAGVSAPSFGQVGSSGIAASGVGTAQIADDAVTVAKLEGWTHSQLENLTPDAGDIFCSSIAGSGQIAGLDLVTVASGDHILIEDASDTTKKKRILASDLLGAYPDATGQAATKVAQTDGANGWTFIDTPSGGGSEVNDLETVCTDILANEIPIGTGTDAVTYTPVAASTVVGRGAAGNIVAAQLETSQMADDAVTLAKIDAHTGAVAGVLGYGASGVPSEISSSATTGHVLKGAGTGAPPVFGQCVTDSYGTGTVTVAKIANGTDGELITWSAAGAATTVGAGASGQVLTSAGAGAVPTFQALPAPKPDSVYIETPVSGDVINWGRADRTFTIARVDAVLDDGTSVVVSFDSGASRATSDQQHVNAQSVSGGTATTTGVNLTKTANLTIESGDWRWFTIGTVTGATGMTITVSYS